MYMIIKIFLLVLYLNILKNENLYLLFLGTDGIPMTADIFFGVIHYQRLRHMVSDKFQVRSQGKYIQHPVTSLFTFR